MKSHPIFDTTLTLMSGDRMHIDAERERNDPDWEQQAEAQRHREMNLDEALNECHARGVSSDALRTLMYETGARWTPKEQKHG